MAIIAICNDNIVWIKLINEMWERGSTAVTKSDRERNKW